MRSILAALFVLSCGDSLTCGVFEIKTYRVPDTSQCMLFTAPDGVNIKDPCRDLQCYVGQPGESVSFYQDDGKSVHGTVTGVFVDCDFRCK
jgi:hypothetical protein